MVEIKIDVTQVQALKVQLSAINAELCVKGKIIAMQALKLQQYERKNS